ncbi:MAG: hypothetical protein VW057_13235 [Rhodospirillaceae bacterium]
MANNKIDMPWSIKGVSSEARTLAKAAAAREGLTMGEWVSQAIRRRSQPIASEATDAGPPSAQAINSDAINAHVQQQIQALEARMVNLAKPLDEVITQLAQRIDALEARLQQQPAAPDRERDS